MQTSPGGGAGQADAAAGSGTPVATAVTAGSRRAGAERSGRPDLAGGMRMFPALLVALAGGLALAGAFPPVAFWPLAAVGPALLVVGRKEAETRTVSIRRFGSDKQQVVPLDQAIAALVDEATAPDVKRARLAEAAE